jgi:hypothetical protein
MLPASKGRGMHRALWWNGLNGRNHLEITDSDDRIIKKALKRTGCEAVYLIYRIGSDVNTVMKL